MPRKKKTAAAKVDSRDEKAGARKRRATGTGALCAEAQADGVPCFEIGRDCDTCERAKEDCGKG